MKRMIYVISPGIKRIVNCEDEFDEKCKYISESGDYEFWEDPAWYEYKKKYGYHFSPKLAELVSSWGHDIKGKSDYWSIEDIENMLIKLGLRLPNSVPICDFMVAVNKEKKEHEGGKALKTPEDIFHYTYEDILSYDYEGQIFDHFLDKIMRLGKVIVWEDFMD